MFSPRSFHDFHSRNFLKTVLRPWKHQVLKAACKVFRRDPIVVLALGKTGSTSIHTSIMDSLGYTSVVRTAHRFQSIFDVSPAESRASPEKAIVLSDVYYLISLIRNPIERGIAKTFFHLIRTKFSTDVNLWKRLAEKTIVGSLVWVDRNLKTGLGIDVYATPFPETGYAVYSNCNHHLLRKVNLLVVRTELDDDKKSVAIREFLGLKRLQITRRNESRLLPHAGVYSEMKQRIKFSPEVMEQVCAHKFTRHFFSTEEIAAMRARWTE